MVCQWGIGASAAGGGVHQPGDLIDIWVVEKQLGSGGMGSVYRCRNRGASRILAAIKVLESSLRKNPEAEARFVREAEILHSLDHPHIVKVRNVRIDGDPPYLEMEFVAGVSLEDWLVEGPVDFGRAVRLVRQLAEAVRYLHDQGIRHRDIKPANLLVQDGHHIKLVDFGLAVETDRTRITQHGMAFGTVSYAPPEWIHPETLDAAKWDTYAIGVVLFEMLTGRFAFPVSGQGSARQQAMQVIVGKQGHRPLDPGPTFPDPVRGLVADLTEADPDRRLVDLDEVVRRLDAIVAAAPKPAANPIVSPDQVPNPPDHLSSTPPSDAGRTWMSDRGAPTVPQHRGLWVAGIGAAVGLGLLGLGGVVAAWIVQSINPAPVGVRDVEIRVDGAEISLAMGDLAPTRVDATTWHFDGVSTAAPVPLAWARGPGCEADRCPGDDCAVWCGSGVTPLEVPDGAERHPMSVGLPLPPVRPFTVVLPAYADGPPVTATLDGAAGTPGPRGVKFDAVAPGEHVLQVVGGRCPPDPAPCWPDGTCEPGCLVHHTTLVVPWAKEARQAEFDVPRPERRGLLASLKRKERKAPEPTPAPVPAVESGPSLVTTGGFAAWLLRHPEWQPEGDKGSLQGADYLVGWTGSDPPAGQSRSRPVVGVTYAAARAYCQSRGGLAALDAPPLTWNESGTTPAFEWRENGLNPGVRDSTGELLLRNPTTRGMMSVTGVRCAR